MDNSRYNNNKKKDRVRVRRVIITLFILVLLPISFLAYRTYGAAEKSFTELERGSQSELRKEEVKISEDPISILLIGLENYSTNYQGGRTDTLMVATFNPDTQSMKLLSIPRDTYTYIEGKGEYDKITHAYGVGGRDETIKAVEGLLEIPIDYYVEVNFEGFKNIVDEIGGIDVQVPFDFSEYTDTHPRRMINFTEGPATLKGEEALAYARMRKQDPRGDFGRNDRQKEIILSLIEEVSSPKNILKIDNIAAHMGENVQTNIKLSEPLYFIKKYNGFSTENIETYKLEGEDKYIDSIYYYSPSDESLADVIQKFQQHLEIQQSTVTTNQTHTQTIQ